MRTITMHEGARRTCRRGTRDAFDRMLAVPATAEGAVLLTSDPVVARYPGPIRRV